MYQYLAKRLSGGFANKGIISREDIDVYTYGFELMISTAANILIVIAVSIVFSFPLAWLFFLTAFIPLRVTAGGLHAKTHLGCGLIFSIAYGLFMLTALFFGAFFTPLVLVVISAACMITVILLSPVPSTNKPLEAGQAEVNRKRSLVIAAAGLVITALSFIAGPELRMIFAFFVLGQFGAALSLIIAKIVRKGQ